MKFQPCILAFGLFHSAAGYCAESTSDENPFKKYFGEWTLKDNKFQQVWDGKTIETLPEFSSEMQLFG